MRAAKSSVTPSEQMESAAESVAEIAVKAQQAEAPDAINPLWDGIITDTIPTMPIDLIPFDFGINRPIKASEAEMCFRVWLKHEIDGMPYMPESTSAPCQKHPEADRVFFPEFPSPSKFQVKEIDPTPRLKKNGQPKKLKKRGIPGTQWDSMEYKKRYAVAEINMAEAKRECLSCPLRAQCLTNSIMLPPTDPDVQEWVTEGVWGGWGKDARGEIKKKFQEYRREYRKGRRSMGAGLKPGDYGYRGWTPERVETEEERARQIQYSA